jgi:hypothetical protein
MKDEGGRMKNWSLSLYLYPSSHPSCFSFHPSAFRLHPLSVGIVYALSHFRTEFPGMLRDKMLLEGTDESEAIMAWYKWNEIAKGFADYVQQFRLILERGAVSIQLYYDEQPSQEESLLVVGLFGNDNTLGEASGLEVELVRKALQDTQMFELGFSLSADASTWAMLVGEKNSSLSTLVGKTFHKEMLKFYLEDLVWDSWRAANGEPALENAQPELWKSAFSSLK